MENLVKRYGKNHAVPTKFDLDFAFKVDDGVWTGLTEILDLLAAYQSTGLTPEEITQLNDFSRSQCASLLEKLEKSRMENAQLRAMVEQIDQNFFKRKCRVCGCDWNHSCEGGCSWIEDDLCSTCAEQGLGGKKDG